MDFIPVWLVVMQDAGAVLVLCTKFNFTLFHVLNWGLTVSVLNTDEFFWICVCCCSCWSVAITEYTNKTGNVYVGVHGIYRYVVNNILWTNVFCWQQVISSGNASVLCLGGAWFESWDQLSWLKFVVHLLSLKADANVIFSIRQRQIPSTPFQFIIHCHAFI